MVAIINHQMKEEVIAKAKLDAISILRQNSAINDYFVEQLRPHISKNVAHDLDPDYFEPVWMSAGYAVRSIFNASQVAEGTIFKISSPNARTSDYDADEYENQIIRDFQNDPSLQSHTDIREIGGVEYLVVMQPGKYLREGCMRCHSDPAVAPAGLVKRYGAVKGFHRKVNTLSSGFTVQVPLSASFEMANAVSMKLSGLLIGVLAIIMTVLYYFNRNFIIAPMASLTMRMSKIAEQDCLLGEQVETNGCAEFQWLADTFNLLSGKLKDTLDEQENTIARRTDELSQSRARFRAMFENMQNCVALYEAVDDGKDFIFLDFNSAGEKTEGITRDMLIGRRLSKNFPLISGSGLIEALCRVWKTGDPEYLAPIYLGGEIQSWRENYIFKLDSGEVVAVYNDVSEKEEARIALISAKEEAEIAAQSKSEFLANMSHEIRTPLNGLFGMLQLLEASELSQDQKEYVELAMSTGNGLLQIINDILDFSRLEQDALGLAYEPYDPKEPLKVVENTFEASLGNKNVQIEVQVDPAIPKRLIGDSGRLRQILFNLVGNAAKFTDEGVIRVALFPIQERGDDLLLGCTVEDTGLGIAEDKLDTIFSPFVQGDLSLTKKYQGTGLGLGIVRKLVELMGGTIAIDSEEGVGSTFVFTFMAGVVLVADVSPQAIFEERDSDLSYHILVVEDDRVNQIFISRSLSKMGHSCELASNGVEALTLLKRHDFDGVLMDIQMPVMNGLEATEAIRSGDSDQIDKDIPIIALTAYAMPSEQARIVDSGVNAYIKKPVTLEDLQKNLDDFFGNNVG